MNKTLIFLRLVDEKESSKIEKNILKDLIDKNISYRDEVIRLIAELCKDGNYFFLTFVFFSSLSEFQRKECVQMDFITCLKDPLQTGDIRNKIESCRALGNMCYENGEFISLLSTG